VDDQRGVTFGLAYDFRNPLQWRREPEELYRQLLKQITWAEGLGIGSVWLTEHHFCEDGYTPSPLTIAAAIGARTTSLQIGTNLMLLPLHDPIRVAEDAATVSLLTGGRFSLGVGMGYRQLEFDVFGRSMRHRPSLLEEGVEVIRAAWTGEPVHVRGRRYQVEGVTITPAPVHVPPLLVGGLTEAAIDRVARIADGYLCTLDNNLGLLYLDALERHGKDRASGRIHALQWAVIDEDPERAWAAISDFALYQWNEYIGWGVFGPPDEVPRYERADQLLEAGFFTLWDAAAAVEHLSTLLADHPQFVDVHFWAQLPGEAVESGSARVEYLARNVIPEVRARLAAAPAASSR
jgi:alkanesulfonate monooxygenase SsuD/methylene tetrahydromethanopterin reductase-like flavin-dependent oxidoreductase (luciferase family)